MTSGSHSSPLFESKYVPKSYLLQLSIDHSKPNYTGLVTVPVVANAHFSGAQDGFTMTLHCHRLVILKGELLAESGGKFPLKISLDRENQYVTLFADTKETPASVSISYLGSIATIRTYHDETYGVFKTNYSDSIEGKSDNYIIATHAQPYGCRRIFPVLDDLAHKVPITLTIQTKSLFKVVSNAPIHSTKLIDLTADSVFEFEPTPPILPTHFGFALGDFEVAENNSARIPLRLLTTKGDVSLTKYALDVAAALFPIFEDLLGPYPLKKFDLVALPFLSDVVMENWGMVTVIRDRIRIDPNMASPENTLLIRQLVAHQLTHQWFANSVSLDDWKFLWFVEAFATFVGNYALSVKGLVLLDATTFVEQKLLAIQDIMDVECFYDQPMPSVQEFMNKTNVSLSSKTNDIFEQHAYEKGMVLLNMIATLFQIENNSGDYTSFFMAFREVTKLYEYKTIKIFDIWNTLNGSTSFDLLSFAHSWLRYTGYPIVEITAKSDKLLVTQNRFFYNNNAKALDIENQPYHVPLAVKVLTDNNKVKTVNLMLTDRSIELDIPTSKLICFNSENQFYYKTVYSPELLDALLGKVADNLLCSLDLVGVIKDYGKILGQHNFHPDNDSFGASQVNFFIKLVTVFTKSSWRIDYEVLKGALSYLEIINSVLLHFSDYIRFKNWLSNMYLQLFNKISSWEQVTDLTSANYNTTEYEVRNMILQGASQHKEIQLLCKRLYKNMINSGVSQKFTPKELFPVIFNVTAATATMTEYKQIMALAKNSNVSYLNHSNGTIQDLQTAAVSSLGFCTKPELLSKTLHFVNNNIDSKLIELCLLGFKFNNNTSAKEQLWAWYTVNYDMWVKRSLRKGSDWAKQIGITTGNISKLVLGEVMQYRLDDVKSFVNTKEKSLPPHKLREKFNEMEEENIEKRAIASLYEVLCV